MAAQADIVLENFKAGGLAQYGLDYASLNALNPRLILLLDYRLWPKRPLRGAAGLRLLIQAMGGLMSITGVPDGEDGAGPQKVGVALTDILTGLYATIGILAALQERRHSGLGQHIDTALLDVQVAALANQASNYLVGGVVPRRMGNAHPSIVPYQSFPTADSDMILAIGNDGQFARFCQVAGHPQWAQDARFATNPQRVAHRSVLIPLLRQTTVMRTTAESGQRPGAGRRALRPGEPAGRSVCRSAGASPGHPGRSAASAGHGGHRRQPGAPERHARAIPPPPPLLGQHTQEVLHDWLPSQPADPSESTQLAQATS